MPKCKVIQSGDPYLKAYIYPALHFAKLAISRKMRSFTFYVIILLYLSTPPFRIFEGILRKRQEERFLFKILAQPASLQLLERACVELCQFFSDGGIEFLQ